MRLPAFLLALLLAALAASAASAAPGKGHAKKPPAPCRPTVGVTLRGPVSSSTPTALTLYVVRANGPAAALLRKDVTVAVGPATRVVGSGTLADGAAVVVHARACRRAPLATRLAATLVVVPGEPDDDAATPPPTTGEPGTVTEAGGELVE